MLNTGRRPALFLDRDGVVNCERGYVCQPSDFEFEPAFWPLAIMAAAAGMPIVIITNQGGIGKGLMTEADLGPIHQHILDGAAQHGLPAPHIYYCPHHPDQTACLCRKPQRLLFERAVARYGVDPSRSWMIGDRERDLVPAQGLGMRTILVGSHDAPLGTNPYANLLLPNMDAVLAHFQTNGFAITAPQPA